MFDGARDGTTSDSDPSSRSAAGSAATFGATRFPASLLLRRSPRKGQIFESELAPTNHKQGLTWYDKGGVEAYLAAVTFRFRFLRTTKNAQNL
jgi:hypothetical protein